MAKKRAASTEPLFQGLDLDSLHTVETYVDDKAEKYSFNTVDFSKPDRPKTCLEVDFPILRVNEIAAVESSSGKPIYTMSKWWARRRSSVFRQILISAATQAPKTMEDASQVSWGLMYRKSLQKAGKFTNLSVADIFMGGGTTVVEASRLGFKVSGVDLNPVAWWVVKNETTFVEPSEISKAADYIKAAVQPQLMPFFTARSPRDGKRGQWTDSRSKKPSAIDIFSVKPADRTHYKWDGAEVIYTYWMKHVMCSDPSCCHLTPQVRSSVVSEKSLKIKTWKNCVCPKCGEAFDMEFGDFRMAPSSDFFIGENEEPFSAIDVKTGVIKCPHCKKKLEAEWVEGQKKKKGKPVSKEVTHSLLLSKKWLKGLTAKSKDYYGGYARASQESTKRWLRDRARDFGLIEVRGEIPAKLQHSNFASKNAGTDTGGQEKRSFILQCGGCGRTQDPSESVKLSGHGAPNFPYMIHGYDPVDDEAGFPYSGRFFDAADVEQIIRSHEEFNSRTELHKWAPQEEIPLGCTTHQRTNLPAHGYRRWADMFNDRQLYVHTLLIDTISSASPSDLSDKVKSHSFGAFQNYLRHNCMFAFWNPARDTIEPFFSDSNFHVKSTTVENGVFSDLGRGNFASCIANVQTGIEYMKEPFELRLADEGEAQKSIKVPSTDKIRESEISLFCASSTDLRKFIETASQDLVITDPPFGYNLNYAEMADFFLVWLHKPLKAIYPDVFNAALSPKTLEAVVNEIRHPGETESGAPKADEMYYRLLRGCWKEAHRILKPGGMLSFSFHHDKDDAWLSVLESLFDSEFVIESAFPVRSDSTKGEGKGAFGSKKIEYDIIHVCRKRMDSPKDIFWATLRKQILQSVKDSASILAQHRVSGLHLADLEVIIRGKVLEHYSKHYGQVFKNLAGDRLSLKEILMEANSIALSLLQNQSEERISELISPETRVLFTLMREGQVLERGAATKRLQGSGVTLDEFIELGWLKAGRINGQKTVELIPPTERWNSLSRKNALSSDFDQAHFAINCCIGGRTFKDEPADWENWLEENYKSVFPSVGPILKYIEGNHFGSDYKQAIGIAYRTMERTLQRIKETDGEFKKASDQMSLFGD